MKRSILSFRPLLVLIVATGIATAGLAAEPAADNIPNIPDSTERKIIGHMQETNLQRLQGWPGMIFYCPGEESSSAALKQVCAETYVKLETLAAPIGVKLHKARNSNDVAVLPHLTGRLKLVIETTATEPGVRPAAIAARIAVLAHYANAINRSVELGQDPTIAGKHPLNNPQHVDAILWEAALIKAGENQDELTKPVADGVGEILKAFFTDYARANPPPQ